MAHKLSIYLIKEEYKNTDSIVKKDGVKKFKVNLPGTRRGTLYFKRIHGEHPKWFEIFNGNTDGITPGSLKTRNLAAVFLLKVNKRFFAFTFGYGRSLLHLEAIEERFGLKVCLNTIDHNNFHVVDRKDVDSMLTQTRTQMSRKCRIEEFGLAVDRIL